MALTITIKSTDVFGNKRFHIVEVAFGTSYPTDGESLTARNLGMSAVDFALFEPSAGYTFEYDHTNEKLKAMRSAGFTPAGTVAAPAFTGSALAAHRHTLHFQVTAAANAVTAAANALRTPAAAFDVAGVADSAGEGGVVDITGGTPAGANSAPAFTGTAVAQAALAEVTDATDLSALTNVRGLVVGS